MFFPKFFKPQIPCAQTQLPPLLSTDKIHHPHPSGWGRLKPDPWELSPACSVTFLHLNTKSMAEQWAQNPADCSMLRKAGLG